MAFGLDGRRDSQASGTGLQPSRAARCAAAPGSTHVPQHANHVWGVDHKGWIRLGDGSRAEPFTVTDGFSRYLIGLAATGSTQYAECKPPLERAFREYGLPEVIRSDNGSAFPPPRTTRPPAPAGGGGTVRHP